MAIRKYASYEGASVVELKGSSTRKTASLDKLADFDNYRTEDNFLYARIRAISSRVNKNHDGWPSIELAGGEDIFNKHKSSSDGFTVEASQGNKKYGFATFMGKPIFVDHNNSDPKRTRGAIVDSKLRVLNSKESSSDPYYSSGGADPEHMPPTEIELLLEVDAKKFPKFAKAIKEGHLDGFSMGCDVEYSKCSHCGHTAHSPEEYCSHIRSKGAEHDYKTSDGRKVSRKSYENCYRPIFFEISGVFDPADETALAKEVRSSVQHEAEAELPQSFQTTAPEQVDTLREEKKCPVCGNDMDGDTCSVCSYHAPPEGFDNPDLQRAHEIQDQMGDKDSLKIDKDGQPQDEQASPNDELQGFLNQGQEQAGQSFLQQKTRNSLSSATVTGEMLWQPKYDTRISGRINQNERPIRSTNKPASNEPVEETVISNPHKPVTSAMLNAQDLIWKAQQRNTTGDKMNTRTADGSTPPDASPDKRVDVTDIGGVIDPSNDSASKADSSVDVLGIGSTGVTGVEADSTESLPTASEKSNDAGFNKDKITEAIPTKTFGDSDGTEKGVTSPVTTETPYWVDDSKWSAVTAGDAEPWPNDEIEGGSANKGTQPSDPVGKAQDRVDVLKPATTPDNNSGPTSQWTGTDGNGVERQQEPITNELQKYNTDNAWTSHVIAAIKIADTEVELGMIDKDEKYNRIGELSQQSDEVLENTEKTLARVRTAAIKKANARTAGAKRVPFALGKETSGAKTFETIASTEPQPEVHDPELLDSGLFLR